MSSTSFYSRRQGLWLSCTILVSFSVNLARADLAGSDEFETMQARAVLLADDELGPLNLGVTVRHHQAVLWGPAPSKELSWRAEIMLRTMLPLVGVRNEFIVTENQIVQQPLAPVLPLFLPDIAPNEEEQE